MVVGILYISTKKIINKMEATQALIVVLLCVILTRLLDDKSIAQILFGIAAIGWFILMVIYTIKEWND